MNEWNLRDINIPGPVWGLGYTILLAIGQGLSEQYPGAEWLPVALLVINMIARFVDVKRNAENAAPAVQPEALGGIAPAPEKVGVGRIVASKTYWVG